MSFQAAHRGKHVFLKGGAIEVRPAGTGGAAEAAEIQCRNLEFFGYQNPGLIPPTLFGEPAAVSEDNASGALAVAEWVNTRLSRSASS